MNDITFGIKAFFLLGIERFLYGYWYLFPTHFKSSVRKGYFGSRVQNEPIYWKSAMTLGMYIKIFQFSVVIVDLLIRCDLVLNPFAAAAEASADSNKPNPILMAILGLVLLGVGQGLNYAVFKALGPIGVYYGYEFGYEVKRVYCFPYNTGISDPQYWGVVLCIWGIYIMLGASSYLIPCLETFWYLMSMKILENPRGRTIIKALGFEDDSKSS